MYKGRHIYLVIATSGRAIAQALVASGNTVAVIDGFADVDTCHAAEFCKKVKRANSSLDANEVLRTISSLQKKLIFDGLLYDSALEVNPNLLDKISFNNVIGNSSKTLYQCNSISYFFSTLEKLEIPFPEICKQPRLAISGSWLTKNASTTGGFGVSPFDERNTATEDIYFQRKLDGLNFSITFFANGKEIQPIGFNTLWSKHLTDKIPYAYAGAINDVDIIELHKKSAIQHAQSITKAFNLVGLNSIDYILNDDCVYVIDINPRIPATYELYETKYGDLIKEHINVCKTSNISLGQWDKLLRAHAIVYAAEKIEVPINFNWPLWTADRPHAGEIINQHQPVCSIFAGGSNKAQIKNMIRTREITILKKLMQIN